MSSPVPARMRRAIFVDVDGTLVSHSGEVPPSARTAVRAARDRGHQVFLCTGRSLASFWADIVDIGWDGVIGASGGYVEVGGEVLRQRHLSTAQVRRVVDYFGGLGVDFFLEATAATYGTADSAGRVFDQMLYLMGGDEELHAQLMRGAMSFVDRMDLQSDLIRDDINKVVYLGGPMTPDDVRAAFPDFDVVGSSIEGFGGEMTLTGVHKATGVATVLEHIGVDRSDSVGFGDSYNDLEMLAYVGIGVAMGNAPAEVQAVADRVTAAVDEDGLAVGMQELGLI